MADLKDITINHPQKPGLVLEELQWDVLAAKKKYGHYQFCFTWLTVQSLIDKIVELQEKVEENATLLSDFKDLQSAFKDASDELNNR